MIKISKSLEWLRGYVEVAIPYLPNNLVITRITAWAKTGGRYGKGVQACIITSDSKSYRIYIHLFRHPRGEDPTHYSRLEILELLAHELAHTLDFDHTPDHKKLEAKLLHLFMNKLKKEGYVSSEEESSKRT